jgi:hypothetical protein
MHAFGRKMFARGFYIFGCHAQPCALLHRRLIIKIIAYRHHHAAFGDIQINRLIQTCAAMLIQHVFARHAHIRRAILHIGRHIRSAHNNQAHIGAISRQN